MTEQAPSGHPLQEQIHPHQTKHRVVPRFGLLFGGFLAPVASNMNYAYIGTFGCRNHPIYPPVTQRDPKSSFLALNQPAPSICSWPTTGGAEIWEIFGGFPDFPRKTLKIE